MLKNMFDINHLSIVMIILVTFIGVTVATFAKRYMEGDRAYPQFFFTLNSLLLSILLMLSANNGYVFLITWMCANGCLVKLIQHKTSWIQAKASGIVAGKAFMAAGFFVSLGLIGLMLASSTYSFTALETYSFDHQIILKTIALCSIMIGAFIQSVIMPFQTWLISSTNAPTPVSALMHAGIVNSGGFIVARFAFLYREEPVLLKVMFIAGLFSAIFGTLLKLIQNDVKRMLAFSTVSQMGFMMLQCGLGLFSAAIVHLCWHGLFKAYLFLSSNSAPHVNKALHETEPSWLVFGIATCMGLIGAAVFGAVSYATYTQMNTCFFLVGLAFIIMTEFAYILLEKSQKKGLGNIIGAFIFTLLGAGIYGISIRFLDNYLVSLDLFSPQKMDTVYFTGLFVLLSAWLSRHLYLLLCQNKPHAKKFLTLYSKVYVTLLNLSQPHVKTVTSIREQYQS
jgi:NAD(P)H-quinone oxidoreductase subunit 5